MAAPAEPLRRSFTELTDRKREVEPGDILGCIVTQPGGANWLVAAADYLLAMGQNGLTSARDASSVDEFYHLQFLAMPYFNACCNAFTTLMDLTIDRDVTSVDGRGRRCR